MTSGKTEVKHMPNRVRKHAKTFLKCIFYAFKKWFYTLHMDSLYSLLFQDMTYLVEITQGYVKNNVIIF